MALRNGRRYFGYWRDGSLTDADTARRHAEVFLDALRGEGFAQTNLRPLFSNPPGLLRVDPYARSRRDRIGSGAGSNATAVWAAEKGMNLQSSTLENDEGALPLHVQQANQIWAFRDAWKAAGHRRKPRLFVRRSIFILVDDRDRDYFGRGNRAEDSIGYIGETTRAIFGCSYAGEPDALIEALRKDEAIAEADLLLSTVPNCCRPCRTSWASATTRTSPSRS